MLCNVPVVVACTSIKLYASVMNVKDRATCKGFQPLLCPLYVCVHPKSQVSKIDRTKF